jgi:hypothetical protein
LEIFALTHHPPPNPQQEKREAPSLHGPTSY